MSGDINSLGHQLNRFSERNRHFRDFTLYSLISTLKEVIACFPVYRTYITADDPVSEHDRRYILEAVRSARRRAPAISGAGVRLRRAAAAEADDGDGAGGVRGAGAVHRQVPADHQPGRGQGHRGHRALHLQPAALAERGRHPIRPVRPRAGRRARVDGERQRRWPAALSATSTHDTKRGEDVRARLNVLSEMPGAWKAAVTRWRAVNRRFKTEIVKGALAPDANEEYLIYQTLVGAWPFETDADALASFDDRLAAYMTKGAARGEGPHQLAQPGRGIRGGGRALRPRDSRSPAGRTCSCSRSRRCRHASRSSGIYNSLAQLLIKITAPGRAGLLSGHRVLGSEPGRSRQPPAGRLRRRRRARARRR